MAAHLEQIARINPTINAIVAKLDDERCLALADEADADARTRRRRRSAARLAVRLQGSRRCRRLPGDARLADLQGLPAGGRQRPGRPAARARASFRSGRRTCPSSAWARTPITASTARRAIRTTTRRAPADRAAARRRRSPAGLLPLADGSDLGGSLRNPGNFNNVVGFRPSPWSRALRAVAVAVRGLRGEGADGAIRRRRRLSLERDGRAASARSVLLAVRTARSARSAYRTRHRRHSSTRRCAWRGVPDLGGLPLDRRVRTVLDVRAQASSRISAASSRTRARISRTRTRSF